MVRFNLRIYLYVLVAAALIIIVFSVPNTPIHEQTKEYVKGLLGGGAEKEEEPTYNPDKWPYQGDLSADDYSLLTFDFDRLRNLPPRNHKGVGHETFATFYASRDPTMYDPYFFAAQQIIYRLLWKDRSKSKHPVTVFVAPFVNQTQRDHFTAAGAVVRELALRPFEPTMPGVPARLQDMFSKLEMWRQIEYSKIAYLDCDAFPMENIDNLFKLAKEQFCIPSLLSDEDKPFASDICRYTFAAHPETISTINAGVMIFKPELAMYDRLVRGSYNKTGWDTGYLEQSLLSWMYHPQGPFPPSVIEPSYNSFPDYKEKGIPIKIVHDKMWAHYWEPGTWMEKDWKDTWAEMESFYKSEAFYKARFDDRDRAFEALKKEAKKRPNGPPPEMQDH